LYRGVTPILNRFVVAQAWDGMEQAHIRGLVGIYSPVRTKYSIEASNEFLLQPFSTTDVNLQANNNWIAAQDGSSMILPDVPMEIGAMKSVAVEGTLPALKVEHDLVVTLGRSYPMLSGKITNHSKYPLKDAMLVTSGNWVQLGNLAPGETKPINVSLAAGPNGPQFYSLDSMSILNITYQDVQANEVAARRSAFLDTLFFREYGINRGNWGIYLMGWLDQPLLPTGLRDKRSKTIDTILYIDRLSPTVKTEPGEYLLPGSLFSWESSTPDATPYYTRQIPTGGYTLRFQPAFPIPSQKVKSLDVYLASNAPPADILVSAWDYQNKTWVQIPVTSTHTNVPDPIRYVGPDGEIKIKVVSNSSSWTEVQGSNVSLVVEP
jgi:hypothetical protein